MCYSIIKNIYNISKMMKIKRDIMKKNDINIRYLFIMHGIKTGNISETCRLFGISRPTYYKWYERYKKYGVEGLNDKPRKKPQMPNKVPKEVEELILDYVIETPKHGPRIISQDLKKVGIEVGEMGVYNVLKRNNLNLMEDRIAYSKKYSHIPKGKPKTKDISLEEIENSYPGYVFQQGTSYIGKFDKIGRVYMVSVVDCYSYFTMAKIYNSRRFENIKEFLETKLIPITKNFSIQIENLITNGSSEYYSNWGKDKHKYNKLLSKYGINQIIIPATADTDINFLKKINEIIYEEFYKDFLENRHYSNFNELQGKLQRYINYYNIKRKIDTGPKKGATPIEVFVEKLDGEYQIPTWLFVNSYNL